MRDLIGLPEFGQDKMLQWAATAFDVLGIQNQRGKDALPVIGEMRDFIEHGATREKLKPNSWTHQIHQLVDAGEIPADCAAYAIRDYINPSLDTTISATAELISQLALNPEQWDLLKEQPELTDNAVNEAVRLGTPIRTFTRHAAVDTSIAGTPITAGSRVMLLFASANRDERRFPDTDKFDVNRANRGHVGFGSGVHMCASMHLAQLEMQSLIKSMITRVGEIIIGLPTVKLNNTICACEKLPCQFTAEIRKFQSTTTRPKTQSQTQKNLRIRATVSVRKNIADNIDYFELFLVDTDNFPQALAGAYIDVHLNPNLVRQYSLTGDINTKTYNIAVQKEIDSRGSSQCVHEQLTVGSQIDISHPRNIFPLNDSDQTVILAAGGIGITPPYCQWLGPCTISNELLNYTSAFKTYLAYRLLMNILSGRF